MSTRTLFAVLVSVGIAASALGQSPVDHHERVASSTVPVTETFVNAPVVLTERPAPHHLSATHTRPRGHESLLVRFGHALGISVRTTDGHDRPARQR
ncbi:MAG TPA: hypothetical protein VGL62_10590 [Vicinamibacterales bacterium]|jgi:hypothetical protein